MDHVACSVPVNQREGRGVRPALSWRIGPGRRVSAGTRVVSSSTKSFTRSDASPVAVGRSSTAAVESTTRALLRGIELLEEEAERRLEAREVIGVTVVGRDESRLHAERVALEGGVLGGHYFAGNDATLDARPYGLGRLTLQLPLPNDLRPFLAAELGVTDRTIGDGLAGIAGIHAGVVWNAWQASASRMTTTSRTAGDAIAATRVSHATRAPAIPVEWAEVVLLVRRQMRSFVGGSSTRDLDDLTQTALERICRNVDGFEGRAQFATYTYRTCASVAINCWRWYRRWLRSFERTTESTPEPAAEGCDAGELAIERERMMRLERALQRLSADKRAVLTLCALEELPASRVAEMLGCPEATVRSRLQRARVDLANILKRETEDSK